MNKYLLLWLTLGICIFAIFIQQFIAIHFSLPELIQLGYAESSVSLKNGIVTLDGERTITLFEVPILGKGLCYGTVIGLILLILATFLSGKFSLYAFSFRRFETRPFFKFLIIALSIGIISTIIEKYAPQFAEEEFAVTLKSSLQHYFWLTIAATCLLVPLFEELIFRGLLFQRIESAFNSMTAVWSTSVLFTLVHIQYSIVALVSIFGLALVLGFARKASNSIYPSLIIHIINNSIALYFLHTSI